MRKEASGGRPRYLDGMAAILTVRTAQGEEQLDLDEFEARVSRGEIAPQCPVQFPPVTGEAFVPAGALEIFRLRYSRRDLRFSRTFRFGGVPYVTLGFCLLNIGWYAVTHLRPIGTPEDTLIAYGAKAGPLLLDLGQFWRLLTANLVHRDLLHIGLNLFVLFNFAGALESAFGPWDMALVFFASALGTTVLSALVSDPISAGASGVSYGALGAALVFGLKYRDLLPERYRRVLGGAVVPTVLVFFYLGFTSTGVDNWGHLGGFLAGSVVTLLLKPRLLLEPGAASRRWLTHGVPMALVVALILAFGPLSRGFLPRWQPHVDDELGVAVDLPAEWEVGASALEGHTYMNALPGYGEARVTVAGFLSDGPPQLAGVLDELTRRLLCEPETDSQLAISELGAPTEVRLAQGKLVGLERRAIFVRAGVSYDCRILALARGRLVVVVEARSSRSEPAYGKLLGRVVDGLRLTEPAFLREAKAHRLFLPSSAATRQDLADALAAVGQRGVDDSPQ